MVTLVSRLSLALISLLAASPSVPQQGEAPQDPSRDNLVHTPGTVTAEPGSLGAVVERGSGPIDMVLVSGFGLGASVFEGFLQRNAERYHMLAVTLAGFEGTPPPPMPPAGTSYGEQTWTRAAVEGVVRLIRERRLEKPVLVGHFLNGTQVAAGVALEHPELVRALVLLAGSPRFEPLESSPSWPRDMTLEQKVTFVDGMLAPRWFKTVTPRTWEAGNFVAGDYSVDEARGKRFAELANSPPLPVLVRYLCEFHASDLRPDLARLEAPLLVLQPAFTDELRADPARAYLSGFFQEPWQGQPEDGTGTRFVYLRGAGILVADDRAPAVDGAIASFLEPAPR